MPFRRSITNVDRDSDDTVYILGNSPYNDVVQRIVRLSLNTLKEETLLEMLYMMPCGMVRMESMFAILDNFFSITSSHTFK